MIHDAKVEVTCDAEDCNESIFVELPAGMRDTYIARDADIEQKILREGWSRSNGRHYCEDCAARIAERGQ